MRDIRFKGFKSRSQSRENVMQCLRELSVDTTMEIFLINIS